MSNASERVQAYLDELSTRNTLDSEIIQNLRPEVLGEIALRASDLRKLLAALEAVLNLANHEPRFRPRMYGGEYFPVNVSADEIIEVITEALQ